MYDQEHKTSHQSKAGLESKPIILKLQVDSQYSIKIANNVWR